MTYNTRGMTVALREQLSHLPQTYWPLWQSAVAESAADALLDVADPVRRALWEFGMAPGLRSSLSAATIRLQQQHSLDEG